MLTTLRSYTDVVKVTNILKRYSDKKSERERERERESEKTTSVLI